MRAWITKLSIRHFVMLTDLSRELDRSPEWIARNLLEREHARVFGANVDDDEVTLPNNCPPD